MSTDIIVDVTGPVNAASVNAALTKLGFPVAVKEGAWGELVSSLPWMIDEPVVVFEAHAESVGETGTHFLLCMHRGDEHRAIYALALALVAVGGGKISDPQGRAGGLRKKDLQELEDSVLQWRDSLQSAYDRLPDAEKVIRQRRPDESPIAHRDRLWAMRVDQDELRKGVTERFRDALASGVDDEIDRIFALLPAASVEHASLVEAWADPCFRGKRIDLARRLAAHVPTPVLRAHFIDAASWSGVFSVGYVQFLAQVGNFVDASLLAQATARASHSDMRDTLAQLGSQI